MLNHCEYDKIKLIHELSSLMWFIEKHAKDDAQQANDDVCYKILQELSQSLEAYIDKLRECI